MRHNRPRTLDATVTLGDGVAVIQRRESCHPIVAGILGIQRDANGEPITVWLDRLVHEPFQDTIGAWAVSGAISSILSRSVSPEQDCISVDVA